MYQAPKENRYRQLPEKTCQYCQKSMIGGGKYHTHCSDIVRRNKQIEYQKRKRLNQK